jgi:hypothetical protein
MVWQADAVRVPGKLASTRFRFDSLQNVFLLLTEFTPFANHPFRLTSKCVLAQPSSTAM